MRMALIRTLALLMLLVLSASILPPDRSEAASLPFCLHTGQECVSCGPDLRKKCTFYVCQDGSEYMTCTQCSLFCAVS